MNRHAHLPAKALIALALATAVLWPALPAAAQARPYLIGGTSRECRDSLALAQAAFSSRSFYLNDAITLKPGAPIEIVGQRLPGDISGGFGFQASDTVFTTIAPNGTRPIYWQTAPKGNLRWVVEDRQFSWRGDFYILYAIDANLAANAFAPKEYGDPRAVTGEQLTPPILLRNRKTGTVWAVNTLGNTFDALQWTVLVAGHDGVKTPCSIRFGPPLTTRFAVLPPAVRRLAVLLDGTLGDGRDEGTMQPTAHLRGKAETAWVNAALRPWAVTTVPYNNRRDAEAGLRRWSKRDPEFRKLYLQIQTQYPLAQQALADDYVARFAKTPTEANALAARNLDIIFRSHFVFPQDFIHPAKPVPGNKGSTGSR
ncbi:hypothetical protein [Asticcacaulis sp. 201]|uniref:hypothetical protein n=1 Tax=Asticcacaulis sp. 201 TaxID=3028787 RepID=UPI00291625C8|nr:hypothetical protein [Asticcacaulis sp. 201]MDV6330105.1 hypothetical protein [Asticcacaulis sp. 201]